MAPHELELEQNTPQNVIHVFDAIRANYQPEFLEIRTKDNFIEELFRLTEKVGEESSLAQIQELSLDEPNRDRISEAVRNRDYAKFEKDYPDDYGYLLGIVRPMEQLKRRLIFQEVESTPDKLTNSEKIILYGSLVLAEHSDKIFFEEWRPLVRDSTLGKTLAEIEEKNPGSADALIPGKADDTRWHTLKSYDPLHPSPDNIILNPYRASLPTTIRIIQTLDSMVELLDKNPQKTTESDYGYTSFLRAWSDCLKGIDQAGNSNQKTLEDKMMTAFRNIDPSAPIFIIPWMEYGYGDPSGRAIAPSFRIGAISTSEESTILNSRTQELTAEIRTFASERSLPGVETLDRTITQNRVWTSFAGLDIMLAVVSQVLPNDSVLRKDHGCYIFPNLKQSERVQKVVTNNAKKGFGDSIESKLSPLRFTNMESATIETEAHERFHPIGVTQKAENRLGKMANSLEEAKASLGGMLAQVLHKQDIEFARRAAVSALYRVPRQITRDGIITHQGYANYGRVVATIAERIGLLTSNDEATFNLDITDDKIRQFWSEVDKYVSWCMEVYRSFENADDSQLDNLRHDIGIQLNNWLGKSTGKDTGIIRLIKKNIGMTPN
jgi:hypothetical protein